MSCRTHYILITSIKASQELSPYEICQFLDLFIHALKLSDEHGGRKIRKWISVYNIVAVFVARILNCPF